MNEYAPGTYTVVFPENKMILPKKVHEIYGLGQYISSWIDNKMVGLENC